MAWFISCVEKRREERRRAGEEEVSRPAISRCIPRTCPPPSRGSCLSLNFFFSPFSILKTVLISTFHQKRAFSFLLCIIAANQAQWKARLCPMTFGQIAKLSSTAVSLPSFPPRLPVPPRSTWVVFESLQMELQSKQDGSRNVGEYFGGVQLRRLFVKVTYLSGRNTKTICWFSLCACVCECVCTHAEGFFFSARNVPLL